MNLNTDVPRTKTVLLQLKHESIVVLKYNGNHENGLGEKPKMIICVLTVLQYVLLLHY